jgi:proton-coupled amino acid transporter
VVDNLGGAHLDKIVWIAIFFVILIPFTLIRNIGRLGFSAVVADICIIVGLIYLYVYDIKELVINQGSPTPLQLFNSKDFGLFIGTGMRLVSVIRLAGRWTERQSIETYAKILFRVF